MSVGRELLVGGGHRTLIVDASLFLLRVFTGLALALAHGLGKLPPQPGFVSMVEGFGFPGYMAWASGVAEFFGGLFLAAGFLTRPAALLIVINHTVAVLLGHAGDSFIGREKALLFLCIAVVYLIIGSGRFSMDALLRRRRGSGRRPLARA